MSDNIIWANAPEGYDYWVEGRDDDMEPTWYLDDGDKYTDVDGMSWHKANSNIEVHARPVWDGNGLPPVGSKVLFDPDASSDDGVCWHRRLNTDGTEVVEILAHYSPCKDSTTVAVFCFDSKDGGREVEQAVLSCFKPLPPEAEQEELDEIERLYSEGGPAALWEAGYRKSMGQTEVKGWRFEPVVDVEVVGGVSHV